MKDDNEKGSCCDSEIKRGDQEQKIKIKKPDHEKHDGGCCAPDPGKLKKDEKEDERPV